MALPILAIISLIKMGFDYLDENKSKTYDCISYSEAIDRMFKHRPDDPIVKGCAMFKDVIDGNIIIYFAYLDEDNKPVWGVPENPYGFQMATNKIDDELVEYFGDDDLVIFN